MPITNINIGTVPNDGTGDTLRAAGSIINTNFTDASIVNKWSTQVYGLDLVTPAIVNISGTSTASGSPLARLRDSTTAEIFIFSDLGAIEIPANQNIVWGYNPTVTAGDSSVLLGNGATVSGSFSVSIGVNAISTTYSVAIGYLADASESNVVSIGRNAITGSNSVRIGISNVKQGTNSIQYSWVGGSTSALKGAGTLSTATVMGYDCIKNTGSAIGSVVLGSLAGYGFNTSSNLDYTVAIGYASGYFATTSQFSIFLGANSGRYESNNRRFIVTTNSGTDQATHQAAALAYGKMDATTANQWLGIGGILKMRNYTAVEASSLTPADGDFVYVNSTDGTFTSVGFWGYENSAWVKL